MSIINSSKFNQLRKLQRSRLFMILMIMSLLAALLCISISLFASHRESKLPANILQLTAPLNPAIDRVLLETIENKRGTSIPNICDGAISPSSP